MNDYLTTTRKLVLSGSMAEFYNYEYPILLERIFKSGLDKDIKECPESPEDKKRRSLARARQNLFRLIKCNAWEYGLNPKTLTLTFAKNFKDLKSGNRIFSKFIQRLNYFCFKGQDKFLKYCGVPEFQKRGALHYHTVFFNLPFVSWKKVENLWGQGFCDIKKKFYIKKIAEYMTKEMVKNFSSRYRLGQKSYFTSRGLKRPMVVSLEEAVKILEVCPLKKKLVQENEFESHFVGKIKYSQYDLGKSRKEFNEIAEKYKWREA